MPSHDEILIGLASVANEWRHIAVAWHVALAVSLLAILVGWRPSSRVAGIVLALPVLSVSAASLASGNPFNGAAFATLFLIFVWLASRLSLEPFRIGAPPAVITGVLLVAFGTVYPHFLDTDRWTTYVYAAPLGLLPCPTLSATMGASLVFGLFNSRPWAFTLAAAGLMYGAIGVFLLGVTLDYALLAGAFVVIGTAGTQTSRT